MLKKIHKKDGSHVVDQQNIPSKVFRMTAVELLVRNLNEYTSNKHVCTTTRPQTLLKCCQHHVFMRRYCCCCLVFVIGFVLYLVKPRIHTCKTRYQSESLGKQQTSIFRHRTGHSRLCLGLVSFSSVIHTWLPMTYWTRDPSWIHPSLLSAIQSGEVERVATWHHMRHTASDKQY